MIDVPVNFLLGVATTASAIIALFFLRFWRRTRDRLFLAFAVAFFLFAINWAMVAVMTEEHSFAVYLFRLLGFAIIIAGVIAKNRSTSTTPGTPT